MNQEVIVRPSGRSLMVLPEEAAWRAQRPLKAAIRGPARSGLVLMMVFIASLTAWGSLVPLAGGAVAAGVVTPDQGQKTVQHLEGGIISELDVRDGQIVTKGEPLLVIEDVQARATHEALLERKWSLLAKQARLAAESETSSRVAWPAELRSSDGRIQAIVSAQQKLFETRREERQTKESVLNRRIAQLQDQIGGIDMQVKSATSQLALITDELKGKKELLDTGLLPKPEYLRLKRMAVEIEGRRGEYLADIAKANQQIGETKMQILAADAERATQIANDSDQARLDLADVIEKLRSNDDILRRTIVKAPIGGTIINLKFKTIGGVIGKGEPILEIVPADDALVIDARVTPIDVKAVRAGLRAEIRFPAYSSRSTPRVPGTVQSVSADRILDQYTHQPYYLARVRVSRELLKRVAPNVKLIPGMPADVLIVTQHQTMFHYLLKPFLEVFRNSFHEV